MASRAVYLRAWRKSRNPLITTRATDGWRKAISEATKKAMQREEVKAKLSKPRKAMSYDARKKHSRLLEGKYPKNFEEMTKKSPFGTNKGWIEVGGQKFFAKSTWERNYARYLQFLKEKGEIKDWKYEAKVFIFEKIQFGNRTYRPDFKVTNFDNTYEWHEVKGWMTPASNTKLKRMAKYFPEEIVYIIEKEEYQALKKSLGSLIKDWESTKYA